MKIGAAFVRDKYKGVIAEKYDKRSAHPKWQREQATVERWLALIGGGSVLDIPVGTGRFLEAYERNGMTAIGMDVSEDMIWQIYLKMAKRRIVLKDEPDTRLGSILEIPMADRSVDCVVAVRILPWLERNEVLRAVSECGRVARTWIITGGGRNEQNRLQGSEIEGFNVVEIAHIDRDARGDYELVLLKRA